MSRPRIYGPGSKQLHIRLEPAEREGLARVAAQNGQTLTAFIREAIAEAVADCTDERVLTCQLDTSQVRPTA